MSRIRIALVACLLLIALNQLRLAGAMTVDIQFTEYTYWAFIAPFGECGERSSRQTRWHHPFVTGNHAYFAGLVLAAAGDYPPALVALEESYQRNRRPLTGLFIGNLYYKMGETDQARRWWQAVEAEPFFLSRARVCGLVRAETEERSYYDAAASIIAPAWTEGYSQLADYYGQHGPADQLQRLVNALPTAQIEANAEAQFVIGRALVGQGLYRQSLPYLEQSARLNPSGWEPLRWAGVAALNLRDYDQARRYVNKALSLEPRDGYLLILMGNIYEAEGQPDEAYTWFERARNVWHYYKPVREMADVRTSQGRLDEAIILYRQALDLAPSHVHQDLRLLLADVCRKRGDRACAVEQYQAILTLDPANKAAQQGMLELNQSP